MEADKLHSCSALRARSYPAPSWHTSRQLRRQPVYQCHAHRQWPVRISQLSLVIHPHNSARLQQPAGQRSQRQAGLLVSAQADKGATDQLRSSGLLGLLKGVSQTRLYSFGLAGAIVLGLGALCDAGFSGDWYRQGVLTHEQEATARSIFTGVAVFHVLCTAVSVKLALDKGLSPIKYSTKVLAVGFPALLELLLKDADR